jgi:trk system potassium uptake protein TrkH
MGSLMISTQGYTVKESLFEMASALGTVGLSVGVSSPEAPPLVLGVLSMAMLLGRLEIFVVFGAIKALLGHR